MSGLLKSILLSRTAGAAVVLGAILGGLEATRGRRTIIQELDGYLGWTMVPGQDHFDRHLEVPEHINSFGFRGREWSLEKTAGVLRIAVQGSSMTYGSSVEFENLYTTRLEKRLQQAGYRVEVFNCAVQGYTLEQCVRNYERKVSRMKPDILIQAFADQDVQPMDPARSAPPCDLRPWITRTDFYYRFQYQWQPWLRRLAPENPIPAWAQNRTKFEQNEKMQVNPFAPELMPLWQAAEPRMQRLYDLVRRDGGQLAIMVLPQPPQAANPQFAGPEVVWKRFVKNKENCEFLDVIPALQDAIRRVPVYHEGDLGGHFNDAGMGIIADAIAAGLERSPVLGKLLATFR
jgi:hypothetical protein